MILALFAIVPDELALFAIVPDEFSQPLFHEDPF
jgi:hypothetical protein